MAQLKGVFADEATARKAVEKLRAMDIPDSDIMLTREGKSADSRILLTAEVPDGQSSAAQAAINTATGSPGPAPQGAGGPADVSASADTAREDFTEEAGGGAIGAVAGGLAGAAVAGPIGAVTGATLGAVGGATAADAVPDADDDGVVYSGRGSTGTAGDVLGTRTDEGATADPDVAAMAGPGVIGHGALGGPAALTARAAVIGSQRDMVEEDLDSEGPDNDGDTINSVSPR
jgi:hypothetical protein